MTGFQHATRTVIVPASSTDTPIIATLAIARQHDGAAFHGRPLVKSAIYEF